MRSSIFETDPEHQLSFIYGEDFRTYQAPHDADLCRIVIEIPEHRLWKHHQENEADSYIVIEKFELNSSEEKFQSDLQKSKGTLRRSRKGLSLNDPQTFLTPQIELRSEVDTTPILSSHDSQQETSESNESTKFNQPCTVDINFMRKMSVNKNQFEEFEDGLRQRSLKISKDFKTEDQDQINSRDSMDSLELFEKSMCEKKTEGEINENNKSFQESQSPERFCQLPQSNKQTNEDKYEEYLGYENDTIESEVIPTKVEPVNKEDKIPTEKQFLGSTYTPLPDEQSLSSREKVTSNEKNDLLNLEQKHSLEKAVEEALIHSRNHQIFSAAVAPRNVFTALKQQEEKKWSDEVKLKDVSPLPDKNSENMKYTKSTKLSDDWSASKATAQTQLREDLEEDFRTIPRAQVPTRAHRPQGHKPNFWVRLFSCGRRASRNDYNMAVGNRNRRESNAAEQQQQQYSRYRKTNATDINHGRRPSNSSNSSRLSYQRTNIIPSYDSSSGMKTSPASRSYKPSNVEEMKVTRRKIK